MQDCEGRNGLSLFINKNKIRNGLLLFAIMMVVRGFAQSISPDTIQPKYKICFEGKFKKTKIEIFADDSLCYTGSISNEKYEIIELAECVELLFIPQTIKMVVNHCKVIHYTCNRQKPFLYCKRKWFWHYSIYDRAKQQRYR